jgi:hypothetical protein
MKNNNREQISETGVQAGSFMLNQRSEALATRLENGAAVLGALASTLSEGEWQTHLPRDGRKVAVIVHHVASMCPIEIRLANLLAAGRLIAGVTWDTVYTISRDHATENDNVAKESRTRTVEKQQRGCGRGHPRLDRHSARQCRACVVQQ